MRVKPPFTLAVRAALAALAMGGAVPNYGGMRIVWQDNFLGAQGSQVNGDLWNVANVRMNNGNNELETYTPARANLQISGGGTLQLVPWRDSSQAGGWTSGRIESKTSFTPPPGKLTKVEASIRMGNNPQGSKQGIWPAFWMLGDAVRTGTPWPQCGELDILEQRNGDPIGFGTAHCSSCNEPQGRGGTTSIPNGDFHTWTLQWDRTSSSWQQETITWFRDGQSYYSISGSNFDQPTWSTLAHSPYYILLNVAVGGAFPGNPNGATKDGYGSMMEVQYVAVYQN